MERDTSEQGRARYHALLRALTPAQRLAQAARLTSAVRTLALVGLRQRHPGADEAELRCRLTVRLYGKDVARRLHGTVPEDAV